MDNGTLIDNSLSPFGLKQAHVVSMGEPSPAEPWTYLLTDDEAMLGYEVMRWHEPELDVHHLLMLWQTRAMVTVRGIGPAACWRVSQGEPHSLAIGLAAILYWRFTGQVPDTCSYRQLPPKAPAALQVWLPNADDMATGSEFEVRIGVDQRTPDGFVLVYKRGEA